MSGTSSGAIDMQPTKRARTESPSRTATMSGSIDNSIFTRLQSSIDRDADFREQLRILTRELDRLHRQIGFVLLQAHATDDVAVLEPARPSFAEQRDRLSDLAKLVSTQPYYRYAHMFNNQLQNACFGVVLSTWLGCDPAGAAGERTPVGTLLTLDQVGARLGVKTDVASGVDEFHLPLEDYLHALVSVINEMSRLAVNSAANGDYNRPRQIDAFIKELFNAFGALNLKNDALRRRFDGIKYDVKKVEEVVYDLKLRGLGEDAAAGPSSNGHARTTAPVAHAGGNGYLKCKALTPDATLPTRGSAYAAGYDLYASADCTIGAMGRALVSTGLAIAVPADTYARIAPRSGLAVKHGIQTGAGVVDADYRGEVRVLLFNISDTPFEVRKGDRIAQMILERVYTPQVEQVESLDESVRGAGGFGSTGQ